jgi:hypothetical protein
VIIFSLFSIFFSVSHSLYFSLTLCLLYSAIK